MIKEAINKFIQGESLSRREAFLVMDDILSGKATEAQISAFLVALQLKGGTVDEIAGSVDAYRRRVTPLSIDDDNAIDTSGTGGDNLGTFNISTAAAIIAAGAGAKVVKHGYHSISSRCGSADILKKLGIKTELFPDEFYKVFKAIGLAFIFAPRYKPTFKQFAGVRRTLGVRTMINILDPLTKPALTKRHLIGVYDHTLGHLVAEVLREFGLFKAMIVSGENGLDELNISGKTYVVELKDNDIREYELFPEDVGLKTHSIDAVKGGDIEENYRILMDILKGEEGAPRDIGIYNAAAALKMAGVAKDMKDGVGKATNAIDSGAALKKLEDLIAFSGNL